MSKGVFGVLLAAGLASFSAHSSQYAGEQSREIKALSPSEVSGLLAGRGMGYARAAELNGYPGPMHVLELAGELELSPDQVEETRALHARMEASAKLAGTSLVEAERELDSLFRDRVATNQMLDAALQSIARAQAAVRGVHLEAHIAQTRLLTHEQVRRYSSLRGYSARTIHSQRGHGHHHPGQ